MGQTEMQRARRRDGERESRGDECWDLRLDKLSKVLIKTLVAMEDVESKHSTKLKHQE